MRLHTHIAWTTGERVVTNGAGYDCRSDRLCWSEGPRERLSWPIPMGERARLALAHEPEASASPDGYRKATCVVCSEPMIEMWHLWLDAGGLKKEIHMCDRCATDIYGAPHQGWVC